METVTKIILLLTILRLPVNASLHHRGVNEPATVYLGKIEDSPKQQLMEKSEVEKSEEQLSIILSEALSKSRIVQENSDVFIQLGKYLIGNSTKDANNEPPSEDKQASSFQPKRTETDSTKIKTDAKPKQIKFLPGYAAWPYLHLPPSNATISRQMGAPGYMKREGKDFDLDQDLLDKVRGAVSSMEQRHRPRDRSTWETMNFYSKDQNLSPRRKWHNLITRHDLYPPNDPELIHSIMDNLRHGKIDYVEDTGDAGTQIKFIVWLEDGSRAMVKPIRFSREMETLPDHYYFADHERHVAEIAAFHLDRLLNFRRVPPVTGRLMNMSSEIYGRGEKSIKREFFISPAGNVCYRGGCDYYCDLHHLTCGRPDLIEVSMMAFLPSRNRVGRSSWEHPWRKSYSVRKRADWEGRDDYCDEVKQRPLFKHGRRMLDLMDTAIFDFLMGNTDRHHFNTFENWDNNTFSIHVDNGKGFGNSREDEMILLLPVAQCCTIRFTTLRTLLHFHGNSVSLGAAMKRSMATDALDPVLLDSHLDALDRRVKLIIKAIGECLTKRRVTDVVIDDGF